MYLLASMCSCLLRSVRCIDMCINSCVHSPWHVNIHASLLLRRTPATKSNNSITFQAQISRALAFDWSLDSWSWGIIEGTCLLLPFVPNKRLKRRRLGVIWLGLAIGLRVDPDTWRDIHLGVEVQTCFRSAKPLLRLGHRYFVLKLRRFPCINFNATLALRFTFRYVVRLLQGFYLEGLKSRKPVFTYLPSRASWYDSCLSTNSSETCQSGGNMARWNSKTLPLLGGWQGLPPGIKKIVMKKARGIHLGLDVLVNFNWLPHRSAEWLLYCKNVMSHMDDTDVIIM